MICICRYYDQGEDESAEFGYDVEYRLKSNDDSGDKYEVAKGTIDLDTFGELYKYELTLSSQDVQTGRMSKIFGDNTEAPTVCYDQCAL